MALVNVYIDGFNLYYGCLKRTPYKWLNLAELSARMLPGDVVQHVAYYTAHVSARPQNPSAPVDQQVYLRALRTIPNLTITLGHFLTHSVPMMLTGVVPPQRVWVDKIEEKGSDVNLGAHLVRDAYEKRFEVAVLITNDSDLAEPVRIVRKLGFPVGILNPHQHHSAVLKQNATFLKRVRQADLMACQFPNQMTDLDWSPKLRQVVKAHFTLNGEESLEFETKNFYPGVQTGRGAAAGDGCVNSGGGARL